MSDFKFKCHTCGYWKPKEERWIKHVAKMAFTCMECGEEYVKARIATYKTEKQFTRADQHPNWVKHVDRCLNADNWIETEPRFDSWVRMVFFSIKKEQEAVVSYSDSITTI